MVRDRRARPTPFALLLWWLSAGMLLGELLLVDSAELSRVVAAGGRIRPNLHVNYMTPIRIRVAKAIL